MNQDRIERETVIQASVERVWQLVTQPGWWIGDGDRSAQTVRRQGELAIVEDPRYGTFPIRTVTVRAPSYIAYRCVWDSQRRTETPDETNSTLVEFWVAERDGATVLRVVESNFKVMQHPEDAIRGNAEGWETQLGIAKRVSEAVQV